MTEIRIRAPEIRESIIQNDQIDWIQFDKCVNSIKIALLILKVKFYYIGFDFGFNIYKSVLFFFLSLSFFERNEFRYLEKWTFYK